LENAVGHQIFIRSSTSLLAWLQVYRCTYVLISFIQFYFDQGVKEQLTIEINAKDVATAEALSKQHNELKDDINAHKDE
jgi:hypothetical protein